MVKNQKRGAMYVRESSELQDEGYSPQKQERTIKEYAQKHDIQIVSRFKDLVSGTGAENRPEFQRMVKEAKEGKFGYILVFHSSRFARNVADARAYKDALRKQGIQVISVTQQFGDPNRPEAFLNEGINELFDEHYSKQLSFWMRNACLEKREQGYSLGNPPLGYVKKKGNTKDWFVDEKGMKIINEAFRLYATGKYSLATVADMLNKKGNVTKLKRPFTYSSLKGMLQNKAYLGFVVSNNKDIPDMPGKHEPIIDKKLFEKVQAVFKQRGHTFGRPVAQHRFYLLQDLLYCKRCEKHLKQNEDSISKKGLPKMYCVTYLAKDGKERYMYGCKYKRENLSCTQPNVECKIIDDQVLDYMKCFHIPEEGIALVLQKLERLFDTRVKETNYEDEIARLKKKKGKLSTVYLNSEEMSEEEYQSQVS
ncbi:MAG: recombinase family protein [Patescibacteria group bacterium]